MLWDQWKQGFDAWESRTAAFFEEWLKNPLVLEPMGAMLTMTMKVKAAREKAINAWWAQLGVATRRDQERTLHALNKLHSRLLDIEEKLDDAKGGA